MCKQEALNALTLFILYLPGALTSCSGVKDSDTGLALLNLQDLTTNQQKNEQNVFPPNAWCTKSSQWMNLALLLQPNQCNPRSTWHRQLVI